MTPERKIEVRVPLLECVGLGSALRRLDILDPLVFGDDHDGVDCVRRGRIGKWSRGENAILGARVAGKVIGNAIKRTVIEFILFTMRASLHRDSEWEASMSAWGRFVLVIWPVWGRVLDDTGDGPGREGRDR
jgi:hypothetical protein